MLKRFRKHIAALLAVILVFIQLPAVALAEDADFSYSVDAGEVTITGYNGSGGEVIIPDTIDAQPVVAIGANAFSDETSITSVVIPVSVATIGDQAFSGCTGLEKATLLNRSAVFDGDGIFGDALLSDAIYGFDGSTAQAYANAQSLPFHVLYTVAFNASGGSPVDDRIVPSDCTFTKPDDPLRDGFAFSGWYDNETYAGEAWNFANDTVTGDITLYAKWTAPPGVPQSVAAVSASYNSIRISWDAVAGANGYTLSRSESLAGVYTDLPAVTATSVMDTGLNTGQDYYYKVKANNAAGSSAYSEIVSATPELGVPQSVAAVSASYNSIRINWDAVSGANGYTLSRSESLAGAYTDLPAVTATSVTDTELNTGQDYYYKVKANNAAGSSAYSEIVSATPELDVPQSVTAVSVSYNSIRISWDAVSGANGYSIWYATSQTGTYRHVTDTAATTYKHTGRTPGKPYYYKIRAYRTGETSVSGPFSAIVSAKAVPAAVSSIKAASCGYTGIKVSWDAVPGAYGYRVYRASSSNGPYERILYTKRTSYTDNFLKPGKTYYYKVIPYCFYNSVRVSGRASKPVYAIPGTANIYDALIEVAQDELGYQEVKASSADDHGWTKFAVDYPIWKYGAWCACFVTWCAKKANLLNTTIPKYAWVLSGKAWYKNRGRFVSVHSSYVPKKGDVIFFHEPDSATNSDNHTGFVEAYDPVTKTIYTIEGNIHDSVDRDMHGRYDAYVTGFGVNGGKSLGQIPVVVPQQAKAVASSITSNTVSWTDKDSRCTYSVYRTTALGEKYKYIGSTKSGSFTDSDFITGKTYYYKVRAYRVVDGTRVYSVFTQPLRASIPVSAASAGYRSIKISWKAVSDATGYMLYRKAYGQSKYTKIKTLTGTSYTNTGLTTGKTYYYKVRAYRKDESGTIYGNYSSSRHAKPRPAKPTLTAKSAGYNSIKLTWTSVPGRTGYAIYRATSKTGTYKRIKKLTGTSYTNTSLTTGKTYYYKVRAYRKVGSKTICGKCSSYKYTTPKPSKPTSVRAVRASSTSIRVTWGAVSGATKYQVYRATSKTGKYSKVAETSRRGYTNSRLKTGKYYYYKVRAYHLEDGKRVYGYFSSVVYAKP